MKIMLNNINSPIKAIESAKVPKMPKELDFVPQYTILYISFILINN